MSSVLLLRHVSCRNIVEGIKGMPNGWSFNWESMTTREMESPGMRCVEGLLVVYMGCVSFCL
jgi:hypothetical protein